MPRYSQRYKFIFFLCVCVITIKTEKIVNYPGKKYRPHTPYFKYTFFFNYCDIRFLKTISPAFGSSSSFSNSVIAEN